MTKQEFIDKWRLQSSEGFGRAMFDCSIELNNDVNELLCSYIKPIFIITLPRDAKQDDHYQTMEKIRNTPITQDYHVLVTIGGGTQVTFSLISVQNITEVELNGLQKYIDKTLRNERT